MVDYKGEVSQITNEIKDSILTDGFAAGIKTAIDNVIDMGKSVLRNFHRKI